MIRLAWKNIWHRPFQSILSMMLFTIGVLMIIMIIHAGKQLQNQFSKNIRGIDMVVGAKGSPLQLILSSVYHIDNPTGNIPISQMYQLKKHPFVSNVVPLSLGDNYETFRIVGTDDAFFSLYELKFLEGEMFTNPMEVVIGKTVSNITGLKPGDEFHGAHGLGEALESHDEKHFKVVGVLEQSGTVADQLILTPLESVWQVHEGHENASFAPIEASEDTSEAAEEHEKEKQITSLLVSFRSPKAALFLPRMINEQTSLQAASPIMETARLESLTGRGFTLIGYIGWVILGLSGLSVLFSMVGNMRKRAFEVAVLRVMGAGRLKSLLPILLEAMIISVISGILGLCFGHLLLVAAGIYLQETYHYSMNFSQFYPEEFYLMAVCLIIGIISALIPMYLAYKKDISYTLKGNA